MESSELDPPVPPFADARLAAKTQEVYERQARRFDAERPKALHERSWLDRFLSLVVPGGRVLDLGCGAGDPIADYIARRGFEVVGVDASPSMLEIARERFPDGDWRRADMRELELSERFDGVIAWNSFFHLMPDVLGRIARHMNAGAALMVTVGPRAGEVAGWVGGESIYHSSLAPDEYREILGEEGIEVLDFVFEDPACDQQTVLLGRK